MIGKKFSDLLLRCVDILLLKNPERTSLGVLLGACYAFISVLFDPVLKHIKYIDVSSLPIWGWLPLGIITMYIPNVFSLILKKTTMNDEVDGIIALIENSNFSKVEKRRMYRNMVNRCLENITLNKNFEEQYKQLQKEVLK